MWEITMLIVAAFMAGWGIRGVIDHKKRSQQLGEPELMWFNDEKSRWDRVTEMQLCAGDRVVTTVPVKLVKDRNEV